MSDEVKETRLDRIATIGWTYAGYAVGALATVLTVINICAWWFP